MDDYMYTLFTNYFTKLENDGYEAYPEVFKVVIMAFLYDLMNGNCKDMITKEDNTNIQKAFECYAGTSCIIPWLDKQDGFLFSCSNK